MGMYVDDELAAAAQRMLAGGQILRRRNAVAAAWPRAGQPSARTAACGDIDRGEQGGHPAGRLQEPPPVDAQPVRGPGSPGKHRLRQLDVTWTRRRREELPVRDRPEDQRKLHAVIVTSHVVPHL